MMILGYINLLLIFITATAILYLLISFTLKKDGKGFIRPLSYLLCFWSFSLIIFATIILFNLPFDFTSEQYILNLQPLQWLLEENVKQTIVKEIIPNIMLFIPFGFFIPIVFKRMRKFYMTALVAFVLTFSIEFFQYFIGRISDIDDLIENLLGGILGYGIFKVCSHLLKDKAWWIQFVGT